MTSPFLPTIHNTSGSGLRTSDTGNQSAKPAQEVEGESSVAFAEVLGGTQQLQKEAGDAGSRPLFSDKGAAFDLEPTLESTQEEFLTVLTGQALSVVSGVTPNSTVPVTQFIGTQQTVPSGHDSVVDVPRSIQHVLQSIGGNTSLAGTHIQESGSQGAAGHPAIPLETLSHGNKGVAGSQPLDKLSVLEDATAEEHQRLRPLLRDSLSPIPTLRSPIISDANTSVPSPTDVQQSLTKLAVAGNTSQVNIGALYAQSRLPQPPEDGAQSITRTDGEGKTHGLIVSSQSPETGLGTTGSGVPFGHPGGNGQAQFFESTSGPQQAIQQSQIAGKIGNFEDRLQLLNTTVPQRLQIDVQLSEATRVQVDVGVQQRQVFAGVLMDNPVLRTLALQNIQALEDQLGQADLELEEFDIHGDEQLLNESTGQESDERHAFQGANSRRAVSPSQVNQNQGQSAGHIGVDSGWHLVA